MPDKPDVFSAYLHNAKNAFPLQALRNILSSLAEKKCQTGIVTLCGNSGCGKTMLLSAIASCTWHSCMVQMHGYDQYTEKTLEIGDKSGKGTILLFDDLQETAGQNPPFSPAFVCSILDKLLQRQGRQPYPGHPAVAIMAFCGKASRLTCLDKRLQTRISQGLVLELQDPDIDVRIRYAEARSARLGLGLEKSHIAMVARASSTIPQVEGQIARLLALVNAGFPLPDQDGMEKIVKSGHYAMPASSDIVHEVARLTDTRPADIVGRSRRQDVVLARQMALHVCRKLLGLSYVELGREFGGRDHSTVMHAIEKFQKMSIADKNVNNLVSEVETCLTLRTERLANQAGLFV